MSFDLRGGRIASTIAPIMKRIFVSIALMSFCLLSGACEKHDWEDTKVLHHHEHHDHDGEHGDGDGH